MPRCQQLIGGTHSLPHSFFIGSALLDVGLATAGEPWAAAMKGHELDPVTAQSDQQRLLLERFQAEHPGFDFSGATFNGQAPNPRTFMGGVDSGLAK